MDLTIRCLYSCTACGLVRVPCEVPARRPDEEDVRRWMDQTIRLVAADHQRRSPGCHPETLAELLIPSTGDRIGGVTRH